MRISTNLVALFAAFVITFVAASAAADDPELVVGATIDAGEGPTAGNDRLLSFVIMPEMVPDEATDAAVEDSDAAMEEAIVFERDHHAVVGDSDLVTGFDDEQPRAIAKIHIQPRDFSRAGDEAWSLLSFDDERGAGLSTTMLGPIVESNGAASFNEVPPETLPDVNLPRSVYESPSAPEPIASNSIRHRQAAANTPATLPSERSSLAVAAAAGAAVLAPLLLLYHRMRGAASLENRTRKSIYDKVCSTTGITANGISGQTGVGYTTVMYHLRRLMTEGMVVETGAGHNRLFYKNGGEVSRDERELVSIGRDPQAMRLLNFISEHPWCYRAEIAHAMGVSTATINWHLRKLVRSGLVVEERDGKNAFLSPCREKMGMLLQMMRREELAAEAATAASVNSTVVA